MGFLGFIMLNKLIFILFFIGVVIGCLLVFGILVLIIC